MARRLSPKLPLRPLLVLLLGLAGCAGGNAGAPTPVAQDCVALFTRYDRLERSGQDTSFDPASGTMELAPALSRQTRLLIRGGCLTRTSDLDRLEDLAAAHPGFRIASGGAQIAPVPVHLGVLTAIGDERAVTRAFRGLGYQSRGIGAMGLGRRIYIGPFTDQAALDQALAIAREAGFKAPYAATQTRF